MGELLDCQMFSACPSNPIPAMVALRFNPPVHLLQQRLLASVKPKMVIIGAAMRKLVHIIYQQLSISVLAL